MDDDRVLELLKSVHRQVAETRGAKGKPVRTEAPPIPHAALPELDPRNPIFQSWNTYRREVGGLIGRGLEGIWIVIKDSEILGLYPAARFALTAVLRESQDARDTILIKQIRAVEPASTLTQLNLRCKSSPLPLAKTA
jgi:hypothetical protein